MNQKPLPMERKPSVIAFTALILAVAAVLTTPLAMSKYAATGTGTAGARIAKFAPVITLNSKWPTTAQNKYVYLNNDVALTNYSGMTFTVRNDGETIINATPYLYYVSPANTNVAGTTFTPANADIAPNGGSQLFTMNVGYSASHTVRTGYQVELFVHIEQVD